MKRDSFVVLEPSYSPVAAAVFAVFMLMCSARLCGCRFQAESVLVHSLPFCSEQGIHEWGCRHASCLQATGKMKWNDQRPCSVIQCRGTQARYVASRQRYICKMLETPL
jgi:hypothetical protein